MSHDRHLPLVPKLLYGEGLVRLIHAPCIGRGSIKYWLHIHSPYSLLFLTFPIYVERVAVLIDQPFLNTT